MSAPTQTDGARRRRPWRALPALAVLAALCAAAVAPAGAPARSAEKLPAKAAQHVTIGISDNALEIFSDPRFSYLGVKTARLVVPWDLINRAPELTWQNAWLEEARLHGVKPLVAFEKDPDHPKQLPTVAAYTKAVEAFMTRYPWIHEYTPWNEENHYLQPTSTNPRRAAEYFNALKSYCSSCSITAADVLDIPNMVEWVTKFKRYAHNPRLWGMHNYADVSAGLHTKTSELLKLVSGQIWFTETGGVVWRYEHANNGHHAYYIVHSETYASKGATHLVSLMHYSSRIARVYYYEWRVNESLAWARKHGKLSWDSGLIRPDCSVRSAFVVIARAMGRNPNKIPSAKRNSKNECVSPKKAVAKPITDTPVSTETPTVTTEAPTGGAQAASVAQRPVNSR